MPQDRYQTVQEVAERLAVAEATQLAADTALQRQTGFTMLLAQRCVEREISAMKPRYPLERVQLIEDFGAVALTTRILQNASAAWRWSRRSAA